MGGYVVGGHGAGVCGGVEREVQVVGRAVRATASVLRKRDGSWTRTGKGGGMQNLTADQEQGQEKRHKTGSGTGEMLQHAHDAAVWRKGWILLCCERQES